MKETKTLACGKADILIKWIMFTAAITGMAIFSAFYPIAGNVPMIVIPSILVLFFAKPVFFERLKLTTLLTMRIIIVFAALKLFNPQVYVDLIMLALIINILEATFTDLLRYKKYFNAISGFALALGVISLRGLWQWDAPFGNYYLTRGVIPAVTLMYVGFLSAPLLGCLFTSGMGVFGGLGMWLLLRANSLAIGGWMQIGAKDWFEREFANARFSKFVKWTKQRNVQIVAMVINLVLIGACIAITMMNGGIQFEFSPLFLN